MASPAYTTWWQQFAATGVITPLSLGMRREQVRTCFGEPDDWAAGQAVGVSPIWRYDSL